MLFRGVSWIPFLVITISVSVHLWRFFLKCQGQKVNVKEALYFIYPSFYLSSKGHVDPRKAPRVYFHLEGWRVEDHEGSSWYDKLRTHRTTSKWSGLTGSKVVPEPVQLASILATTDYWHGNQTSKGVPLALKSHWTYSRASQPSSSFP